MIFTFQKKKKKIYNFQTNTKEKESVPAKLKQSKLEEKRGRTEECAELIERWQLKFKEIGD